MVLRGVPKAACSVNIELAAGIPFVTWGLGQTLPLLSVAQGPPRLLIECWCLSDEQLQGLRGAGRCC